MCFDSFCRFGLLSGHWSDPFQYDKLVISFLIINFRFIKHDLVNENSEYHLGNTLSAFSPEYTYQNIPELESKPDLIFIPNPINQQEPNSALNCLEKLPQKAEFKCEDPDVTQLEIDIVSASISNSQISKKRQLVSFGDILDIQTLQSNVSEFE